MLESIDVRVSRSLARLGFHEVQVADIGKGGVKLTGRTANPEDEPLLVAAARTVVGVKNVEVELRFHLFGE